MNTPKTNADLKDIKNVFTFDTASVEVAVGFTDTSGVFVAVITCGVMPAPIVAAGAGVPGVVVSCAIAEPVAKAWTSLIFVASADANKLFCGTGVNVSAGACEYGVLQADVMITTSIRVEAIIMPRFILAMDISSILNQSLNDGSTSPLMRQVLQ